MKKRGRRARPRDESKAATRDALIYAALAAFAEEGFDGPSLDSICARAGYTRGAFYVNFKDREDLIVAVIERTQRGLLDALAGSDDAPLDVEQMLRVFAEAVAVGAFPPRSGAIRLHQFIDACHRSPRIRDRQLAMLRTAQDRTARSVSAAQAAGRVRSDLDPRGLAAVLLSAVQGVELMIEYGYPVDVRAGVDALLTMLRPGPKRGPAGV